MHAYFSRACQRALAILNQLDSWLPLLLLRLLLAWEFGEAGWAKWQGENWFSELSFPFPFNLLPAGVNWNIAMTFELAGALALLLGLCTRFFSFSLIIITIVAIVSVHWPEHVNSVSDLLTGYRFEDTREDGLGNYKLPLIYLVMLLPLVTRGAGKFSLDHLIHTRFYSRKAVN